MASKAKAPKVAAEPMDQVGGRFSMDRWEPGAILGARRALRQPQHRGRLNWLLSDKDRRQTFTAMAYEEWRAETGGDGKIISFIKWIVENPEKIAALIKLISGLFGGAV